MNQKKNLYISSKNPLLIRPNRPLPKQVAIIGAGTIGPDIGYYLKSALPDIKLYLVDVVEKPLKKAQERLSGYVQKAGIGGHKIISFGNKLVYSTKYLQ